MGMALPKQHAYTTLHAFKVSHRDSLRIRELARRRGEHLSTMLRRVVVAELDRVQERSKEA